jgi:hypothetical protein
MARRAGALATALAILSCASLAHATVIQEGNLRITILSQVQPYKLPRKGTAPIEVFVAGHLSAPHGGYRPSCRRCQSRSTATASCSPGDFPPAGSLRSNPGRPSKPCSAAATRRSALGSSGPTSSSPTRAAYPTHGRLLIFNGTRGGKPVLLTHIFTANPFFSSFVIVFAIRHISDGAYGTRLTASLPKEVPRTVFPLALASFDFGGGVSLSAKVEKACAVSQ